MDVIRTRYVSYYIMAEKAKETLEMVNILLRNEKLFGQVVKIVFESIDTDRSGTLELAEMENFLTKICEEMNIAGGLNNTDIKEIFETLDADKSKSIGMDEMATFLKKVLNDEKKSLDKVVGENK